MPTNGRPLFRDAKQSLGARWSESAAEIPLWLLRLRIAEAGGTTIDTRVFESFNQLESLIVKRTNAVYAAVRQRAGERHSRLVHPQISGLLQRPPNGTSNLARLSFATLVEELDLARCSVLDIQSDLQMALESYLRNVGPQSMYRLSELWPPLAAITNPDHPVLPLHQLTRLYDDRLATTATLLRQHGQGSPSLRAMGDPSHSQIADDPERFCLPAEWVEWYQVVLLPTERQQLRSETLPP